MLSGLLQVIYSETTAKINRGVYPLLGGIMKYLVCDTSTGKTLVLDGEYRITPNFQLKEFVCSDGNNTVLLNFESVRQLQILRYKIGVPITVLSGHRSLTHNKKVGGADDSEHLRGNGHDISAKGYTPWDLGYECLEMFGPNIGFHVYNTWVHVDFRGYKARW